MHHEKRQRIRLANTIREGILGRDRRQLVELQYRVGNIADAASHLRAIQKQIAIISSRTSMVCASRSIISKIETLKRDLIRDLQALDGQDMRPTTVPAPRDTLAELNALEDEFGEWHFDPRQQGLSVTTDPVTLEGMYLGPFAIRLSVGELPKLHYTIEALDPHPAAQNSEVTHPHVSSGELCEGEARAAIAGAINEGRVADFFMLVRSILNTYNSHSPFVSLESWHGSPCNDCGSIVSEEYEFYCERCDTSFCDECYSSCEDCGSCYCYGCLSSCQSCDSSHCSGCMDSCANCEDRYCSGCLQACSACEEMGCESCTGQCEQCSGVHCKSCMDGTICEKCEEAHSESDSDQTDNGDTEHESNQEEGSAEDREVACEAGG